MIRYNKINKNGFTLIELLAVIVILAIIALIATPFMINVIDNSRKGSFKESVNNAISAAELYKAKTTKNFESIDISDLEMSGTKLTGKIKKSGNVFIAYNVTDGEQCGNGERGKVEVTDDCLEEAEEPNLTDNNVMIPIKWDGNKWVKADENNTNDSWYDYSVKRWANAVTVTGASRSYYQTEAVGTEVKEEDILTYMVWIPRFRYKLFNADNKGVPEQQIEIVFEEKNTTKSTGSSNGEYLTHPAFTFGSEELNGFWVGKFETTGTIGTVCTTETCTTANVTVKPNQVSLKDKAVSNMFYASRSMSVVNTNQYGYSANVDTHMMKNMEWGAVAYLTQSRYGRCMSGICSEVSINNSSGMYTGRSGGDVGGSTPINGTYTDQTDTTLYNTYGFYTYDDYLLDYGTNNKGSKVSGKGTSASTTGNIYGIYDMSGGSWEYVMGSMKGESGNFYLGSSGFSSAPESKYYNSYTYDTSTLSHNRGLLGDATRETLKKYGDGLGGWYDDYALFVYSTNPWFRRGGDYISGTYRGIFSSNGDTGGTFVYIGFRVVHK